VKALEFQERVQGFRLRSKASDRQTCLLDEGKRLKAKLKVKKTGIYRLFSVVAPFLRWSFFSLIVYRGFMKNHRKYNAEKLPKGECQRCQARYGTH
jgi:hypothetical protein